MRHPNPERVRLAGTPFVFAVVWITLIVVIALALRVLGLSRLPGVNGDEACYAIQALNLLSGHHVDLVAPTGRLLTNPFLFLPMVFLHLFFQPSFWILRAPALLAGIATVGFSYVGLKRIWGETRALSVALLLASLPINIAYSRFGWDPSILGIVGVALFIAAVRGVWYQVVIVLLVGIVVHPTALFFVPIALGLFLGRHAADQKPIRLWGTGGWIAIGGSMVLLLGITRWVGGPSTASAPIANVIARAIDIGGIMEFVLNLFKLLSGSTIIRYLVSAEPMPRPIAALEIIALLLGLLMSIIGLIRMIRQRDWLALGCIGGTVASLGSLYLLTGQSAVVVATHRYAYFAIVPMVICAVLLSSQALAAAEKGLYRWGTEIHLQNAFPFFVFTICSLLLFIAAAGYLYPLQKHGSDTGAEFVTGPVEPKQKAWEVISGENHKNSDFKTASIVCEDYWIWMPVAYLAARDPHYRVLNLAKMDSSAIGQIGAGDFLVVYTGGETEKRFRSLLASRPAAKGTPRIWFVQNTTGQHFLSLFRI